MNLKKITISNILSIESETVEFNSTGLTLVDGWNFDSERANGAGKTSLLNSISFALYDKLPRKISASEILRKDSKKGHVELEFRTIDGNDWTVIRNRPKCVKFFKNGVELSITQEEFEAQIKLNYDQFLASMYLAQGSSTARFLAFNDSDKKEMLVKLLNLDKFSVLKKNSEDKLKAIITEKDKVLTQIEICASKVSLHKESLVDEQEINQSISALDLEIIELKDKLSQADQPENIQSFDLEIDELNSKLKIVSESKIRKETALERIEELSLPVHEDDKCDKCGSLIFNEKLIKHRQDRLDDLAKIATLKTNVEKYDIFINQENLIKSQLDALKSKKRAQDQLAVDFKLRLSDIKHKISAKEMSRKNLTETLHKQEALVSRINDLIKLGKDLNDKKDALDNEITLYKTITSLASPTGVQAYVIDSMIELLNQYIADNTAILWPNMVYSINSHKENAKGELVAKLSDSLTIEGKSSSIGSLSGGEYKALSLCVDFAIISLIEKQFGIDLNPIMLDEPFDGLDLVGRDLVIDLLNKMSVDRSIMVIDHASEAKSMFSNVIFISKRNGVSTISKTA